MKVQFRYLSHKATIVLLLCFLMVLPAVSAWATFISPKRVMIETRERTASLTILNTSEYPLVYRFAWENRAQNAEGKVVLLEEGATSPGYNPLNGMVQFSPRQVILKPKEHQKIRFLVRRPADLAEGEYHSHFLIKTEPIGDEKPVEQPTSNQKISGILRVKANVSIPVFLRHGKTNVDFTLQEARLFNKEGVNYVHVKTANNSTRSVYLKSELDCKAADGTVTTTLIQSVKLYAEAPGTDNQFSIPKTFTLDKCTSLDFKLSGTDDFEHQHKVLATIPVTR